MRRELRNDVVRINAGGNGIMKSGIDKLDETQYPRHNRTGLEGKSMPAEVDELLTVQELCELLKVSKSYIYWLRHQGKIPYIKMHGHLRFRRSAIDDWLRAQEVRSGNT